MNYIGKFTYKGNSVKNFTLNLQKSRKGDKNERKYMKMAEKDQSYEGEGEHIDNGGKEEKE